jgi:arylsulfate sulfotransferase
MRPKYVVVLAAAFSSLFLSTFTSAQNADGSSGHLTQGGHEVGLAPGTVSSTANPQVALYTLTMPRAGSWSVSFGLTTAYGQTTSVQPVDKGRLTASMYVAGMLPNTTYHMQATVTLKDKTVATDRDHTFTTGSLPPGIPASLPVTLGTGSPQPGIELIDVLAGQMPSTALATDVQGNVIWTYPFTDRTFGTLIYPAKLLPNGDVMLYLSPPSYPLGQPGSNIMREIDLAGNTIHDLPMADLNAALADAGFSITLQNYSHDFVLLPNGHYLIIANTVRAFTDLPGYPGTTNVVGDAVVDLDTNWKPVWVWNEFDHFDVNRHPMQFPDWTHTNSVAYSPEDGNFIVSIRHQNWIVKVDYRNGHGSGNLVWKLGEGGDFELKGGVDPTDWFYAQHDAQFITAKSTGEYSISIMDNGNDRIFPTGVTCSSGDAPPCLYSTIQIMRINESAKKATLKFHQILPTFLYSGFAGNVEIMANGNIEYDLAGTNGGAEIFEVTDTTKPTTVWNLAQPASSDYRGFRLPSLYPGVQW